MNNKSSLSKDIENRVAAVLILSFTVAFVFLALLLYLTAEDIESCLPKICIVAGLLLCLTAISIVSVNRKVRYILSPLNIIAKDICDEDDEESDINISGLVDRLSLNIKELENTNNELEAKQEILGEKLKKKNNDIDNKEDTINEYLRYIDKVKLKCDKIQANCNDIAAKLDVIQAFEDGIKTKKQTLFTDCDEMKRTIKNAVYSGKDALGQYEASGDAYKLLNDMLRESMEQLDNLYSELSGMQNCASSSNLYAMNTALEVSRSGFYNINIINGMDEIKEASQKMLDKSDDIALLLIQAKNSINLAMDQAGQLLNENKENKKVLEHNIDVLDNISNGLVGTLLSSDEMLDNVSKIMLKNVEIASVNDNNMKYVRQIAFDINNNEH